MSFYDEWWRFRLKTLDGIRYSPLVTEVRAALQALRVGTTRDHAEQVRYGLRAYRTSWHPAALRAYRGLVANQLGDPTAWPWREWKIGWETWARWLGRSELERTLVVKAPGPNGEKGLLLICAEYNWLRLLIGIPNLTELEQRFRIVFSAGWSPTDYSLIAALLGTLRGPIYIEPGNYAEIPKLQAFHPRIRCVPTLCSDWIDPSTFRPKPFAERQTDFLMVANWAPFKRHWHLLEALTQLPTSLRITLIGQPDATNSLATVRQQAQRLGVRQNIRFLENLSISDVQTEQCDAKAVLLFSRHEGPCVAVTEAFCAGAPVGMLQDVHVGTNAYINERTGVLLAPVGLANQLRRFLAHAADFDPRAWATEQVSCAPSLAKWETFFRTEAAQAKEAWLTGLTPFRWRPFAEYINHEEALALRPLYQELNQVYPKVFGAELIPTTRS